MAIEVTISTLGRRGELAFTGDSITVEDILADGRVEDYGYDDSKVVRVNGEDANDSTVVNNGDVISFATPATKHG